VIIINVFKPLVTSQLILHLVWMYKIGPGIRNSGIRTRIPVFGVARNLDTEFGPNSLEDLPNSILRWAHFRPHRVRNSLETKRFLLSSDTCGRLPRQLRGVGQQWRAPLSPPSDLLSRLCHTSDRRPPSSLRSADHALARYSGGGRGLVVPGGR
jgi:hypothetical protein